MNACDVLVIVNSNAKGVELFELRVFYAKQRKGSDDIENSRKFLIASHVSMKLDQTSSYYATLNAVVMWSLANEPDTKQNASLARLIRLAKAMDPTRPLTVVYGGASEYYNDQTASMVDVISMNRYYGWYRNPGHPETIDQELKNDIFRWSDTFKKPILITEYGADTFDSLSFEPAVMFSPQYQLEVFSYYHRVFDSLMQNPLIGEMVWNFADFMTDDTNTVDSKASNCVVKTKYRIQNESYWINASYFLRLTIYMELSIAVSIFFVHNVVWSSICKPMMRCSNMDKRQ
ncbi:glycosyl hydrolase family 2, TIM barrel domain protein [Trichuris suis]|nr:glycosyl hydrolase family 2, TIM barrel domain protein [Trichuris suis]